MKTLSEIIIQYPINEMYARDAEALFIEGGFSRNVFLTFLLFAGKMAALGVTVNVAEFIRVIKHD